MIKKFFFLLIAPTLFAQSFSLTSGGFDPVQVPRPALTNDKIIEAVKSWSYSYNKRQQDVFNVTDNSLEVDAIKDNAFYYHNLGEMFSYNIKYNLKISMEEKQLWLTFSVKEIYTKKTLLKMTTANFFNPDGSVKDDFDEAKDSLDKTANNVARSLLRFLASYQ